MRFIDLLALTGAIGYAEVKAISVNANHIKTAFSDEHMELIDLDPAMTQTQVEFTCNGSLNRMKRESEGTIVWPSGNFTDISFPPNNSSLSWTTDYSNWTWYSPSDVEAVPSLWGTSGVTETAVD